MSRQSREVWSKRVERWSDSGLTAKEFAAELGINARTLKYWKWRLGSEERSQSEREPAPAMPAKPVEFIRVEAPQPSTPSEPFEILIDSALTIRVPSAFDPDALRRLLDVVR